MVFHIGWLELLFLVNKLHTIFSGNVHMLNANGSLSNNLLMDIWKDMIKAGFNDL